MESAQHRLQHALTRFSLQAAHWLDRLSLPEWSIVMGTALIVGVGSGLGAVVFHGLTELAQRIFLDLGGQVFAFLGNYYILIIPALGALIGGPLVFRFAREAKGHGVPEVMAAVALRGGRIRPRVAVIKALASAITIGSGGSVGSEGPIVQIGSALGSTVGQVFRLSDARIRSLVACGAAGGISAIFNAPIAGAIFALEIILGEFQAGYFGAVVISAVMADVIAHLFEGQARAFHVPSYTLVNPGELLLYALLGVLAAMVALVYNRGLNRLEDVFDRWKGLPDSLKPALGGLGVGIVGALLVWASLNTGVDSLAFPREESGQLIPAVFGVGYEVVNPILLGQITLGAALVLLVCKLAVTMLTLGPGSSGGIFAPALVMGSALGVAFGQVVNSGPISALFSGGIGPAGAYALVGMAAVFAGTTHAPATAILILFEMTGNYNLILPLMFATVISALVARAVEPESIYTLKLARRGVRLQHGRDVDLMESVTVAEAMTTSEEYDAVPWDLPLTDLMAEFERTHHHGFPVVDDEERLVGIVTVTDMDQAVHDNQIEGRTVRDIATIHGLLVAYPDESLGSAMLRMSVRGVGRLPVVSRQEPHNLIGMVRRDSLVRAYHNAIARRTHVAHRLKALQQHGSENVNMIEVDITDRMPCVGRTLRDLAGDLPEDCIVVSIRRDHRVLIPHGDTVLRSADHLTVLAARDQCDAARAAFG